MSFHNLPLDILDSLCQFVPPTDLLSLSLSNSALYPFAQRYLYREITLYGQANTARCLRSMQKKRELGRYVKQFSLRLEPDALIMRSFVDMLAVVLSDMRNLISLDLVLPPSASYALSPLANATATIYSRLESFSCSLPFDAAVCAFLERTPSLKELQLGQGPGGVLASSQPPLPCSLPASALPRLALFMGPSEAASVLVPGRPLETVHLYSGDLSEDVLFALARSAAPISIFGAFTHSLSPSILLSLASNLPHLHHLRIMTMYHSSYQPDDVSACLLTTSFLDSALYSYSRSSRSPSMLRWSGFSPTTSRSL